MIHPAISMGRPLPAAVTMGGGIVFELTPAYGGWTFNTLYNFPPAGRAVPKTSWSWMPRVTSTAQLTVSGTMDTARFKLTPSNGGWTYTSLHAHGGTDGAHPFGPILMRTAISTAPPLRRFGELRLRCVWEITRKAVVSGSWSVISGGESS